MNVVRPQAAALAVVLALTGGLLTAQGVRLQADPAAANPQAEQAERAEQAKAVQAEAEQAEAVQAKAMQAKAVQAEPAEQAAAATPGTVAGASPAVRGGGTITPRALGRSVPTGLDIPAIGVHTGLLRLGLNKDGTVEVPPLAGNSPAGWYEHSVTPGENGSAVLLGHVDSARDGPAVFYRLAALKPGDAVSVRRADGSTVRFGVTGSKRYPKKSFPTDDVYGPSPYPVLRLITCGGSFDRGSGSYRDNLVVSARAVG